MLSTKWQMRQKYIFFLNLLPVSSLSHMPIKEEDGELYGINMDEQF
jgi:hypothetical protein